MGLGEEIYREFGARIVPPSWRGREWSPGEYLRWSAGLDAEKWWEKWAEEIFWFKRWDRVLDDSNPPFYKWFVGGKTSLAYLCTDWQLSLGRGDKTAIIWEGEPWDDASDKPLETRRLTYRELRRESARIAYALREVLGVRRGEIITLYMPMIPELPLYMLASQRIGAPHSVVFSGFSSEALATRIIRSGSRILVTADAMYRRGRLIKLKPVADEAARIAEERGHKVERIVVVRRAGAEIPWRDGRDVWHHELLEDVPAGPEIPAEEMESTETSFVLYTSGTTGAPKGVQHSVGGYAVGVYATMKMVFDVGDGDVYWCTADVGWITGHSYVVYGPLMTGVATVIYEGAPDYPGPDRWWSIIERYRVSVFYTAPTAIRMLMRYPGEHVEKHDLSSIRIAHSVGEPINPEAWRWYYKKVGGGDAVVSSTWWMTETGHILTGHFPGLGRIFPLKPGTNGYPIPGVRMEVVDEEGKPCPPGVKGYLVVLDPWPGMLTSLLGDPEAYVRIYWGRFSVGDRRVFYTGDYAVKDGDGMIWVLGRADDVLKVAGHRVGTAEVESAMVSHPAVAEAACVGKRDPVKGEVPVVFAVLRYGYEPSKELAEELRRHLRKTIGPVIASDTRVVFVKSLPKTRSGKIMRRTLKAILDGAPLGDTTTLEDASSIEEARRAVEEQLG